jgi:hypothetical protein
VLDIAPNLLRLVPRRLRARQSVHQGLLGRAWTRAISGGLTTTNAAEYLDLWAATEDVILNDRPDRTVWQWTPDGEYSAKSAYNNLHVGAIPFRGHTLIWKSWAPLCVKIFLWLAFNKRHWTNDRRARHGLDVQVECFLCDQVPESIDHILTSCPYTRELWCYVLTALGKPMPLVHQSILAWWRRVRALWQGNIRKGADSLFALVCWQIWKERNARCFRQSTTAVQDLLE